MNANIVKMQIFQKNKSDLRGHSRSQIMTFLIKNSPFLLFMLLFIDGLNAADHYEITKFDLYKDNICLVYLSCFDLNLRSYGQLFVLVLFQPKSLTLFGHLEGGYSLKLKKKSASYFSLIKLICKFHKNCFFKLGFNDNVSLLLFQMGFAQNIFSIIKISDGDPDPDP